MKLIVNNVFRDKEDHVTVYEPESILEVNDKERAADLVKRGLCSEYKGNQAASATLGDEAPAEKTPVKETPEAPAEETPKAAEKTSKSKVTKK